MSLFHHVTIVETSRAGLSSLMVFEHSSTEMIDVYPREEDYLQFENFGIVVE